MERWPSGLRRTLGKRVYVNSVPWVRIPLSPPVKSNKALKRLIFIFWRYSLPILLPIFGLLCRSDRRHSHGGASLGSLARRRRLAARRAGRNLDGPAPGHRRSALSDAQEHQSHREPERRRRPPHAQRQALARRPDGAALGRRRAAPSNRRLPPSTRNARHAEALRSARPALRRPFSEQRTQGRVTCESGAAASLRSTRYGTWPGANGAMSIARPIALYP